MEVSRASTSSSSEEFWKSPRADVGTTGPEAAAGWEGWSRSSRMWLGTCFSRELLRNFWVPSWDSSLGVILFFFFNLLIYFCLHWVFMATQGLSLVAVSGGYSSLRCAGFSLWWLLLLGSTGSKVQAQHLWHMGLVALQHEGSSQIRDWTHVSCIGRRILHHWATREAPRISTSNPSFASFMFRYCLSCKTFSCTHLLQLWTNLIARFSVLS